MPKLTIMRGVPGSGKSTWAESQAGNPIIVSRDRIRAAMFGTCDRDYYAVPKELLTKREKFVTKVQNDSIEHALKMGHNVIVDNTGIRWQHVREIADLGWKHDAQVEVKVIDVPLATALERNAARQRVVEEKVIREMHGAFQQNKNMVLEKPESSVKPYFGTPGKPMAILVDVDGTLAHMNGKRGPFEWDKVHLDDADDMVISMVESLAYASDDEGNFKYTIIILSGRDGSCRSLTEKWLDRHGVPFDAIFMRAAGDMRADNIVKAELFDHHIRDNFDVQFVIDDRWKVCQMWLEMGLKVFNVSGLDRGEF